MNHRQWITSVLLCATSALHLSGCRNNKEEPRSLAADAGTTLPAASNSFEPSPAPPLRPPTPHEKETLDPGIGRGPPTLAAGTMDVGNRYPSTVMLVAGPQEIVAQCSGIIIHPRLVLTAASCVCTRPSAVTGELVQSSPGNRPACAQRAFIKTVHYGAVADPDFKEDSTEKRFHTYEGRVRPHPGFTLHVDSQGSFRSSSADLAVILLDSPVKQRHDHASWARTEVRDDESLVMVGYASDPSWGGTPGIRYFRRNKVTQVLDVPRGRILYEQSGAFVYDGYPGGPCFRELGLEYNLVGIASRSSEGNLSFTSVYAFRDWLQAEVQHATESLPVLPSPLPKAERCPHHATPCPHRRSLLLPYSSGRR